MGSPCSDSVFDRFGVRRWINASGYLTRLGGNRLPEEVSAAMAEAATAFVDMAELQAAASLVIARHTGAEAGIVTSGASAALTLATAACICGLDPARMDRLPHTEGMANEVVMSRAHRNSYDHAVRAAGARIVEYGVSDAMIDAGMRGPEIWEAEAQISNDTVAFLFHATAHNFRDLSSVVDLADRHNLPVIVDAAPWLPPIENLSRFIGAGAALVAFSGGKAMLGPQGTGLLCGRRDLIASALLQQMDMNMVRRTWTAPEAFFDRGTLGDLPRHGIGRSMKVSKEEIIGLLVALECFVSRNHRAVNDTYLELLGGLQLALQPIHGIRTVLRNADHTGRRPVLDIQMDVEAVGMTAFDVSQRFQKQEIPIQVTEHRLGEGILTIDPAGLLSGEELVIAGALRRILGEQDTAGTQANAEFVAQARTLG